MHSIAPRRPAFARLIRGPRASLSRPDERVSQRDTFPRGAPSTTVDFDEFSSWFAPRKVRGHNRRRPARQGVAHTKRDVNKNRLRLGGPKSGIVMGCERLDLAALAGVRNARFVPYRENGVPQPAVARVPVRFTLDG